VISLHAGDAELANGRTHRKNERPLAAYLWRPAALAATWELTAGGGMRMPAIGGYSRIDDDEQLDVPGHPVVVGLPGHTRGSVGYGLPDHVVCFTGDALVTLNLLTGQRGPRLLAAGFMEDTGQALSSLDRLARIDATILLPGHGDPWTGPMSEAVTHARDAGIS
jgi:glyoxylase-like metal-dependent hydrolase (beta-lactamase superfamily II)